MDAAVRSRVTTTSDCDGTNCMRDWIGGGLKTLSPLPGEVLIRADKQCLEGVPMTISAFPLEKLVLTRIPQIFFFSPVSVMA